LTAITLALLTGIVLSWSRGAWLGAAGGLAAVALLSLRGSARAVLAVVLMAAAAFWTVGPPPVKTMIESRLAELTPAAALIDPARTEITDANFAVVERVAHWQAGLAMFADHPLLGVGIGNYAVAYPDYAPPHFYDALGHAHNVYVNFLAETGLLGTVPWLVFWFGALWWAARSARRATGDAWMAAGVLGCLVYLSIHNFFDNLFVAHMQLQLALLLGGLASAEARSQRT
jgi:putative inorganic carbon (hco3(-)) transporter